MNNFEFYTPTKMLFGRGQIEHLPGILGTYGKNVLLVYGGGSIKKNGIYDTIYRLCADFAITELPGVQPNPRITSVRAGAALCKSEAIDVILAVGGGSTIDCAKVVSGAALYGGDAWDLMLDPGKVTRALPVVTVLTIAATGSEMNKDAVVSNEETKEKLDTSSPHYYPKASILDPTTLYTLPPVQTAAGTVDIMSHIFEEYFSHVPDAYVQDRFAEGVLKACIHYGPLALEQPDNYEARANLMWTASMALCGVTSCGRESFWSCHPIQYELAVQYDITHGTGLAIITPRWMRHVLNDATVDRFASYGVNVWGLSAAADKYATANAAIDKTERLFRSFGLPMTLAELGIGEERIPEMAAAAIAHGEFDDTYVPLTQADIESILRACL